MLLEHIILFLAWVSYYAIHSLFASSWMKSRIKLKANTYRLFYSLSASLLFGLVMLYTATTYSVLIFPPSNEGTYIGLMLSAVGIFVIKRSFRQYSFREFMGLKSEEHANLNIEGIQATIRHPLYAGTFLLFIGYFVFNPQFSNLVMLISLLLYLPFGIRFEEKKLIDQFGENYLEYKKSTPALLPKFKRK